jgi:hypothetical protein
MHTFLMRGIFLLRTSRFLSVKFVRGCKLRNAVRFTVRQAKGEEFPGEKECSPNRRDWPVSTHLYRHGPEDTRGQRLRLVDGDGDCADAIRSNRFRPPTARACEGALLQRHRRRRVGFADSRGSSPVYAEDVAKGEEQQTMLQIAAQLAPESPAGKAAAKKLQSRSVRPPPKIVDVRRRISSTPRLHSNRPFRAIRFATENRPGSGA